jgi:GrpB-like predicted nucleotidyltransferase (UPF0157 family)
MARMTVIPYNSAWPDEFRAIATTLRAALGDLAIRIDHIGSTSVPGLAAKDVIDIQITVASLDQAVVSTALAPLGYTPWHEIAEDHVPPGADETPSEWQKLYFSPPPEQRDTHIHVRVTGRANQRYALLFRDYLRAAPHAAGAYAQVKLALSRLHPDDPDAYYDIKDPACDLIIDAAERWAATTSYTLGPSDA